MSDLGEQPIPETEPAEPPPGGVDAIEAEEHVAGPLVPDLTTRSNPDVDVPAAVTEGEDTEDGASTDGASEPEVETQA